ncbi:hypothetical protein NC653_025687 [Populus alba x Populus x berolinensis]|uniref:SPX domain-containing protein n=1 Tax=Populus alba x Populus x berolinensis TaxID=444605 RepID=A0AAD6MCX8_9ROSI|nr:hypothetical protein NC653_025687 [Populus alba x Populus x berolinensis]
MALRLGMLKCAAEGKNGCRLGIRKWTHLVAMAPPLDGALECSIASPQFTLPEFDANQDTSDNSSDFGFTFPGFSFGGSMELMAVPKRKIVIIINEGIYSDGESGRDEGKMKFGKQFNQPKVDCKGDIEDQVIDVNALPQDGCRKFYTTQFLRESEEGGKLQVKFFKKFDEQLNKFNTFYKDKLDEMKHEASLLNKQMDAFIALRIKVESPGFEDSCAKKSCDTGVVTTNPLKSCSPSRDTPSGLEDMDVGHGVETSNDFQPEKSTYEQNGREHMESTIEMDRRNDYDQEESTHCPGVNEINATNYGNAHQEKDILIHCKFYP